MMHPETNEGGPRTLKSIFAEPTPEYAEDELHAAVDEVIARARH